PRTRRTYASPCRAILVARFLEAPRGMGCSCGTSQLRSFSFSFFQMTPVRIIRGASTFGRDHSSPERGQGRALCAESRTVMRFLYSFQNLPTDADRRFLGIDLFHFEDSLRVVITIFPSEFKAALRNPADTTPFTVGDFKYVVDQFARGYVAVPSENAGVLVLSDRSSGFELADDHQRAL